MQIGLVPPLPFTALMTFPFSREDNVSVQD
jgi:hypothetical protein